MHNYILDEIQVSNLLLPQAQAFADIFQSNRGADGIRVSAILALFVPIKYHEVAR